MWVFNILSWSGARSSEICIMSNLFSVVQVSELRSLHQFSVEDELRLRVFLPQGLILGVLAGEAGVPDIRSIPEHVAKFLYFGAFQFSRVLISLPNFSGWAYMVRTRRYVCACALASGLAVSSLKVRSIVSAVPVPAVVGTLVGMGALPEGRAEAGNLEPEGAAVVPAVAPAVAPAAGAFLIRLSTYLLYIAFLFATGMDMNIWNLSGPSIFSACA